MTFIHSRDLYNNEDTRQIALETFEKNKPSMMHVAIQGLEIDLKIVKKWPGWSYVFYTYTEKCYFELIKLTKFSTQTKPPFTFDGHDTGFP